MQRVGEDLADVGGLAWCSKVGVGEQAKYGNDQNCNKYVPNIPVEVAQDPHVDLPLLAAKMLKAFALGTHFSLHMK